LRSILVIIFTLILAGLSYPAFTKVKWALVEKGLDTQPRIKAALDSLKNQGYETRWLTTGFPLLTDSIVETQPLRYRELTIQIARKNVSDAVVFATNRVEAFAGVRSSHGAKVHWISEPASTRHRYSLQAYELVKDSIILREGHTDANATDFVYTTSNSNTTSPIAPETVTVGIVADKEYAQDVQIIKASLRALNDMVPERIAIEESPEKALKANWCIWLSRRPAPPLKRKIVMSVGPQSDLLMRNSATEWRITKRLNEYVAIHENVAVQLAELILPNRAELERVATSHDRRMLPNAIAWSAANSIAIGETSSEASMEPFLIFIFLFVLAIERSLAYRKNQ
jgi:hypothetical protein